MLIAQAPNNYLHTMVKLVNAVVDYFTSISLKVQADNYKLAIKEEKAGISKHRLKFQFLRIKKYKIIFLVDFHVTSTDLGI